MDRTSAEHSTCPLLFFFNQHLNSPRLQSAVGAVIVLPAINGSSSRTVGRVAGPSYGGLSVHLAPISLRVKSSMLKNPLVGSVLTRIGLLRSSWDERAAVVSKEGTEVNSSENWTRTRERRKSKTVPPTRTKMKVGLFEHTSARSHPSSKYHTAVTIGVFPEGTTYTKPL